MCATYWRERIFRIGLDSVVTRYLRIDWKIKGKCAKINIMNIFGEKRRAGSDPAYSNKIRHIRSATLFMMVLERTIIRLSPFIVWVLAYMTTSLFMAPQLSDNILNLFSLLFYLVALVLLYRGIRHVKAPDADEIDRRLEFANKLKHRPLGLLRDKLANPYDKTTRELWNRQQRESQDLLKRLRPSYLMLNLAQTDKYAFRIALALLVITGFVISGDTWSQRLEKGFVPNIAASLFPDDRPVTLWITPPEYTNLEQQIYENSKDANAPLSVPVNSTIKLRAYSAMAAPSVVMENQSMEMTEIARRIYEYEGKVENKTSFFAVKQFFLTRAIWPVEVVSDSPPVITQRKDVQETELQALRFPLTLSDDYGVKTLVLNMDIDPMLTDPPLGEPLSLTRIVATGAGEEDIQSVFDLTDHPWAGLPVRLTMTAKDYIEQESDPYVVEMTLPERSFEHPVAQKLVKYRKELAWTPEPSSQEIAHGLETLLLFPEDIQHDTSVYLGIQTAARRLEFDPSEETVRKVMDLLWEMALKLEDGNLSLAMRALENAHRDLSEANNDPSLSKPEIEEKTKALRDALNTYLRELGRELRKEQSENQNIPRLSPEILDETLNPQALDRFMDRLEENIEKGNRDKADELLSQLRDLMDMLDPSLARPLPDNVQNMVAGVNELQELIDNLRDLKYLTEKLAEARESFKGIEDKLSRFDDSKVFEPEEKTFPPIAPPGNDILKQWGLDNFPPPPQLNPDFAPDEQAEKPSRPLPDLPSEELPQPDDTLPMPDTSDQMAENGQEEERSNGSESGQPSLPGSDETADMDIDDVPPAYRGKTEEQKAMRYVLGELMKDTGEFYGEIPENMGDAELLMRDAEDFLLDENATNAVPKQQEAIDKLLEAQQDLADQLEQMLEQNEDMAMGPGDLDPLGRQQQPGPGQRQGEREGLLGSFVEIPEESQRRYIEDIIKQLRDKAGDLDRPQLELDYIERLLEKF